MSEATTEHPAHGETIAPLEAPARPQPTAARPGAGRPTLGRDRAPRWQIALGAVALAVAAAVVFWVLPEWGAQRPAPPPPSPEPTVDAGPKLSPEQIAALKAQGEALLAELLPQQKHVAELSPGDWAGEDWARYQALGQSGDDAYLKADYAGAVDAYTDAVALGKTLVARAAGLTEQALAAGQAALAAGQPDRASEQFKFVLAIHADDQTARAGLARAEQMPQVLELLARGGELEKGGELDQAIDAYRSAAKLDPAYAPAAEARDRALGKRADARFEQHMSAGLEALTAERFDDAHAAFEAALAIRPDAKAAQDGLEQAELGRSLDAIQLAEARALAFERRELWNKAIEQYKSALATDATLDFANEGLARAEARADLDVKLENLLANPDLLFRDDVLAQAKGLLGDAQAIESPGPRLESQTSELGRLIALASEPLSIELKSDQKTEVTLYRVGALGVFDTKEVQLRPGTYTIVGSRDGYRDVRQTFTVLPGHELEPIVVECLEPI